MEIAASPVPSYTFVWIFIAIAVIVYIELLSFVTKQGVYRFVYLFFPLTILPFLRFDDITSGGYRFYFIPFSILILFYIFGSFHQQSHLISYFVNLFSRAAFAVGYVLWLILLESLSHFIWVTLFLPCLGTTQRKDTSYDYTTCAYVICGSFLLAFCAMLNNCCVGSFTDYSLWSTLSYFLASIQLLFMALWQDGRIQWNYFIVLIPSWILVLAIPCSLFANISTLLRLTTKSQWLSKSYYNYLSHSHLAT